MSGTCIPTFSSQVRKRLYVCHFCGSFHPNVRKSLLQLSPSLHMSDTLTRNQTLPLFHCAQIFKINSPVDVHSKTSTATRPRSQFPFFLPLVVRRGVKKNSFIFTCSFTIFLRLSKTFCFLVTDWRWRGWIIWWPDECCSQNAAVITKVELETVEREVFSIYRLSRGRRRSLKTASFTNLTRLNRNGEQYSVT